jgi:hypothetical protein
LFDIPYSTDCFNYSSMTVIRGKEDKKIAYLYANCIFSPGNLEIIGIVLGNCVYGRTGKLKAKLIDHAIYTTKGEKLAIEKPLDADLPKIDLSKVRRERWALLNSIKNHDCPWIEPKEKWADYSLDEFLTN